MATTEENVARAHRVDHPGLFGDVWPTFDLGVDGIGELLERRAAERPAAPFLVFCDDDARRRSDWTRQEFLEEVRQARSALLELHLAPGDRIAVADEFNHSDTLVTLYAAWACGLAVAPLNLKEDDARLEFILTHAGAKVLFARDELLVRLAAIAQRAQVPQVVAYGEPRNGDPFDAAWDDLVFLAEEGTPLPPVALGTQALIVYTSGTTGPPKGVVLTHEMLYDAHAICEHNGFTAADVFMTAMPLFHVNAIVTTCLTSLWCGGSVVLNRKWKPTLFWSRAYAENVSATSVVPAMLKSLTDVGEDVGAYPGLRGRLKTVICGAGQLYVDVAEAFTKRFGVRITHGWGMSETTCYSCFLPRSLTDTEYDQAIAGHGFPSIGVPLIHNQMGILDPATGRWREPAPFGAVADAAHWGEIVVSGRTVMQGYFHNEEANAKAFTYGVLQTGDQGFCTRDSQGRVFFFIVGRIKELIERGGEKYSTFEIDQLLRQIPGVENALAYGFKSQKFGQEIGAVIERVKGATVGEEEVQAWFRRRGIPWEKSPKVVKFVDSIPKTATGKDQRLRFAALFDGYYEATFRPSQEWLKA
ncbi:MAG: class I adenylate-forming enzyme family protein [Thermoplasmatota archaeon]